MRLVSAHREMTSKVNTYHRVTETQRDLDSSVQSLCLCVSVVGF